MNNKEAINNLLQGIITDKSYKAIESGLICFLATYKIPKHLTINDIISIVITKAYNSRHTFNKELSLPITWLYTIARYEMEYQNKKQNKSTIRIPETSYIDNQIQNENGYVDVFETLDITDDTSIDDIFNASNDISILLYDYILENNFKVLEEFVYNNLSMKDIVLKYDLTLSIVKNRIRSQRLKCIEKFTGTKDNIIFKSHTKKRKKTTIPRSGVQVLL